MPEDGWVPHMQPDDWCGEWQAKASAAYAATGATESLRAMYAEHVAKHGKDSGGAVLLATVLRDRGEAL